MKTLIKRTIGGTSSRLFGLSFDEVMALGSKVVRRVETHEALVAITFDDGPSQFGTPRILEILSAKKTQATFFLLGQNALAQPQLVTQILDDRHEIGCHGYAHLDYHWLDPYRVWRDAKQGQQALLQTTQQQPAVFRAPFGHFRFDATLCCQRLNIMHQIGWDVSPPWNESDSSKQVDYVLTHVRPGSIILLHDGYGLSESDNHGYLDVVCASLPTIIDGLTQRGFRFVSVSNLLQSKRSLRE